MIFGSLIERFWGANGAPVALLRRPGGGVSAVHGGLSAVHGGLSAASGGFVGLWVLYDLRTGRAEKEPFLKKK